MSGLNVIHVTSRHVALRQSLEVLDRALELVDIRDVGPEGIRREVNVQLIGSAEPLTDTFSITFT